MSLLGYTVLLLFWIYCAAQRACEEPPPRRVKEVPTVTWDKPPYPHGTQATYKCRPGYIKIGRIMFQCTDGVWEQPFPWAECRNKPCGHPGDIQFGSFELTNGREFVFGARVEYRCDDGEVSIIDSLSVKQLQITNILKIFSYCLILNSERLRFSCDKGYRYGERSEAQCSESGWTPTPYCTEIVCSPPRIPDGHFGPQEDIYKEGAVITVHCNSGYHFKVVTGQNTAECTKNGWVPSPECVGKPCDYPVIENGALSGTLEYYRNRYFPAQIGQQADYHCRRGYSTPSGENWVRVVCSARGWLPEPKCLSKYISTLENGYFLHRQNVYKEGERIRYTCGDDYNPENQDGEVTCTKNDWSPPPRCIRKSE
uniref:Sushi domain-containing protein n=1 Tax=Apteryx owenii TaxID=8824 RepID=A0A8B9SA23_APTOW